MPIEIPKPGRGIPGKLRPWLEQLRQQILTARGIAGKFVSIDVHPGKGTVYNADRRPGSSSVLTTCPDWATIPCITITFSGITSCDDSDNTELNGSFVLSNNDPCFLTTPNIWQGLGGISHGASFDTQTYILVVCAGSELRVVVGDPTGADQWFDNGFGTPDDLIPPTVPNTYACADGALNETGTATISISSACGACCDDADCYQVTSSKCGDLTDCIGHNGTFQGVGVSCDPNPCGAAPAPLSLNQKALNLVIAGTRVIQAATQHKPVLVSAEEQDRRQSICNGCEFFNGKACAKCGCFIGFKTKLATEHCPIGKW